MRALAKVSFWLALGCWVGAVVVVSFVVAPAVFGVVPRPTAGIVMGSIFPRYYRFGIVVGWVALGSALVLWHASRRALAWTANVLMLVVMLAATTYAGTVVQPGAAALRPALQGEQVDPAVRARFDLLHRRAVQLNGLVLVLGIVTVAVAASRSRLPGE